MTITMKQAAAKLNVTQGTIINYANQLQIEKVYNTSRERIFTESDLKRMQDLRKQKQGIL